MKTLWFVLLLSPLRAFAFPEMTTHGYVNCTACHVSPTGGSTLTEYGRGLSKELLSMSSGEKENEFFYGAVKTPSWLLMGGDVRAIQTYLNTDKAKEGMFFLMQADLATAMKWNQWTLAGSLGIKGGPDDYKQRNDLISRNHYLMYQMNDAAALRVGRFVPQYGINEPNHTIATRAGIGFGTSSETDNAEFSYLGERWDAFLTAVGGRPEDAKADHEKGFSLGSSFNFFERNKIGISAYHGINQSRDRWLAGVWGILGLTKNVSLLSEFDHQWSTTRGNSETSTRGLVSYQRLGYELVQGLQIYGTHQLSYLDLATVGTRTDSYGGGFNFFPRPHLEIRAEYLKERMLASGPDYFDAAWLVLHYYF